MKRLSIVLFGLLTAAIAVGCNEAQPTVDRVQPNVLDKSTFEGEWYFLQTVIDTPYSASYTFVGEQGPSEKIVWEIQEDFLIARRSYEHIDGSELEGIAGASEHGAAIAMYAIESHFDIRRQYNTVTGEELNVLVENTTDRPWFDRDYFRVDWSENQITNNDFLLAARLFDGIETEPVAYYVQEGSDHPHAPVFEHETVVDDAGEEQQRSTYIDIVNKMFVRPTTAHIEGFGDIPTCFLVGSGHLDCAPGEITIRSSFMRVDESRDYQPFVYTGDRMDRFGYFVTERAGYDPAYGVVEPARFRFTNRHNLWMQSHRLDAEGELLGCTETNAAVTCGGGGSICDIALARANRTRTDGGEWLGACTIPYRERQIRPIAYHVSANFPEDLLPDIEDVAAEWNRTFVGTAGSLRENECLADGGDADSCAGERLRDDAQDIFTLCHNPVIEGDNAACGPAGTSAQIGDLRYNLFGWVSEPHASSPLGYGPSAADPETGELIQANAFVYGAGIDTLTSFARDILSLLNDDISTADITNGAVVESWVERQTAPGSVVTGRPADDHVVDVDGFNLERVASAMDFSWAEDLGDRASSRSTSSPSSVREMLERYDSSLETLSRNGAFGNHDGHGNARLRNLIGTDVEAMMTGDEMRQAADIDPFLPIDDRMQAQASPLQGMSLGHIRALQRAKDRIASESHCLLHADFADDGLLGLAREIKRTIDSGDGTIEWYGVSYDLKAADGSLDQAAVRSMLRHPIFNAVMLHEVGHTVGLRHNFSGSYDSLNYNSRYWQLRDDGSMRPRAWDPMTQAEIDGRIREYQYSTVMDYGNNFVVTDAVGLGHYDHAAIKMGYGDMVEVFTNAEDAGALNWVSFIQSAGWPVLLTLEAFTGGEVTAHPYTDIPGIVGGVDRLEQRADVDYDSLRPDSFLASQGIDDRLQDASGRPIVPYLFCSDEQADLGPDCLRYDAGADAYETISSVLDQYWNYYIFNAYRRGRLGYSTSSYANRVLNRYMAKAQYANQIYSLYRPILTDIFGDDPSFDRFWTREDGMGSYTAAVSASFQMFTQIITAPEPGGYSTGVRGDGTSALLAGGGTSRVDAFDGRAIETTWNFDAGYFWFDQLERSGFYYDKVLAIMVLADPQTHFLGRDTAADLRRYQISFYSSYGPSMEGFFRGLLGEDWGTVAPRLTGGELVYPDPVDLREGTMPGLPVDPNASFSIQLFAAAYGMALIPETFDQTYMNKSRIWVVGGAEGVEIDPSVDTIRFLDTASGLTYVAASYPDASGAETGPGAQMLLHAQDLADAGSTSELARYLDTVNIVRRLSWLMDFGG